MNFLNNGNTIYCIVVVYPFKATLYGCCRFCVLADVFLCLNARARAWYAHKISGMRRLHLREHDTGGQHSFFFFRLGTVILHESGARHEMRSHSLFYLPSSLPLPPSFPSLSLPLFSPFGEDGNINSSISCSKMKR